MQIKLIFTTKVVHLASFESEGFLNSEVAYFRCPSWGLYGYFLEPHNRRPGCLFTFRGPSGGVKIER